MAFTTEQIEAALLQQNDAWYALGNLDRIKSSLNYDVVTGYLTGKYNSLQALQSDYETYLWVPLLNLLENIETPGANDQLVLDVILHPEMASYPGYYFTTWLANYVMAKPTDQVLQAALGYFRIQGLSNIQVIEQFLFNSKDIELPANFLHEPSPLRSFLLTELKKAPNLITGNHHYRIWKVMYFYLLEEARPELALEYAISVSIQSASDAIAFFVSYKEGQYLPPIIQHLQAPNYVNLPDKLATGTRLFDIDPPAYAGLVTDLSLRYLEDFKADPSRYRWESSFGVTEFDKTPYYYLYYSIIAFHFLLKLDREKGLQLLYDFQQQKIKLHKNIIRIICHHLPTQQVLPYLQQAIVQEGAGLDYLKAAADALVNHFEPAVYLPLLWNTATSKSKPFRELVADILVQKDGDAAAKAIALLDHKKTEARQMAAMVLSYFFDSPAAQEAMRKVLNREVNETARDILLDQVAYSFPAEPDAGFINNMIEAARNRGKLNKPVEDILDEEKLPALYYTSGEQLNTEAIRFLLYRMKRVKTMRSDPEARLVISRLDKQKSSDFALHIIKRFIEAEGKPEHKYLLALAALIGDDEVADKIRTTLNNWIEENRLKMAEHGVGALALLGTNKALRWVEWYSRKYRNKKAAVGAAALAALEAAAIELNITTYELGDRIVPDFGFDGLFKHFTAGGESYRAFIDSNFKIAFFNDDNKKLKALPAAADNELKEEFKAIAKEVRDVVKSQSSRLEYYLVIQRRWTVEQWQQFFLNNPIMFIYATKLLWGVYENNQLTRCFYCQEDTTLADEEDSEVELPEGVHIGIVHPLQLTPAALQVWSQKFFDLAIDPVFPQLNRPVYTMAEEDKQLTIVRRFDGVKTAVGSIKSTLEKYGWAKGPAEDAGSINLFYIDDDPGKVKAVLEVEGVFAAGFDTDMDPKLGRLYFLYNSGDNQPREKRWFNTPNDDTDLRLTRLEKVPEVFYSEVIAGISAIKLHQPAGNEKTERKQQ